MTPPEPNDLTWVRVTSWLLLQVRQVVDYNSARCRSDVECFGCFPQARWALICLKLGLNAGVLNFLS